MADELRWVIPVPASAIAARAVSRAHNLGHPLVAQVLLHRGLIGEEITSYLLPDLAHLFDPRTMSHLDAAVRVLDEAIRMGRRIVIAGDYDVDGTTATALVVSYLRTKGADVDYFIPARFDGYGLTSATLEKVLAKKPGLILTVDCGTSSRTEIESARAAGVEVIVTDHHPPTPGKEAAGIVVNPHARASETYPNKGLAGVGVAYKLIAGHYGRQPTTNLDLVALGMVADVMPLSGENRILVRAGLERLAHTKRIGLAALLRTVVKRPPPCPHGLGGTCLAIDAETISFQIAPRINAISRMGLDPNLIVELFLTTDEARAVELAKLFDSTNQDRRTVTDRLVEEALEHIDPDEPVIVQQLELDPGVAGLVAGNLAGKFNRPTIIVGMSGTGSARSIDGVDLRGIIQANFSNLAVAQGHDMAMGISEVKDVNALRAALLAYPWPAGVGIREVEIDAVVDLADLDFPLVRSLEWLEPTGKGNPRPTFMLSGVRVNERTFLKGGKHVKLTLGPREGQAGNYRKAIWFGAGAKAPEVGAVVDVAVKVGINRHPRDGSESVEAQVVALRPSVEFIPPTLGAVIA